MQNTEAQPFILSSIPFNKDSYKITHIKSSLKWSKELREKVDLNWKAFSDEARAKGSPSWDNTFYRFEKLESDTLYFSTIKYSELRGLTHNTDLSQIEESLKPFHISTGSLILTADGYFVFGVRNKNTMSKSSIDLIGGGLQPDELEVNSCEDIFKNQIKEIQEELGINKKYIDKMIGMGIVVSSKSNVIFSFFTKLKLNKEEVYRIFHSNNDEEMSDLEFVPENELIEFLKDQGSYRPLVGELYKSKY